MKEHKHNYNSNENRNHDNRNRDRHHNPKFQDDNRQKRNSFFRAGQIFSIIYHLASFAFAYLLLQEGEKDLAFKLLAINAALVAFAYILSAAERRFSPKHNRRGRGGRRDNRPHNKKRFPENRENR